MAKGQDKKKDVKKKGKTLKGPCLYRSGSFDCQ